MTRDIYNIIYYTTTRGDGLTITWNARFLYNNNIIKMCFYYQTLLINNIR